MIPRPCQGHWRSRQAHRICKRTRPNRCRDQCRRLRRLSELVALSGWFILVRAVGHRLVPRFLLCGPLEAPPGFGLRRRSVRSRRFGFETSAFCWDRCDRTGRRQSGVSLRSSPHSKALARKPQAFRLSAWHIVVERVHWAEGWLRPEDFAKSSIFRIAS